MVEKYVLPEKCRADFVKENGVYRKLSTIERYCRRGYLSIVKGYSGEERCAESAGNMSFTNKLSGGFRITKTTAQSGWRGLKQ